jgi:hypothetical protein
MMICCLKVPSGRRMRKHVATLLPVVVESEAMPVRCGKAQGACKEQRDSGQGEVGREERSSAALEG